MTATAPIPLAPSSNAGQRVRLSRLDRHGDGRLLIVPLDHSVTTGPVAGPERLNAIVRGVAHHGGDAVVLHKGRVRFIDPELFRDLALIVHLSASTVHAADSDAKTMVSQVEDAVACGADVISVHVNVGSDTEAEQLADLGAVAEACRRWSLPLLAMMYPRGPRIAAGDRPDLVAHVASLGADLGADLVKVPWAEDVDSMADVVASCPIPVVVAGGSPQPTTDDLRSFVGQVMSSGACGVAMGRTVFDAADPARVVREVAGVVHPGPDRHAGVPHEREMAFQPG